MKTLFSAKILASLLSFWHANISNEIHRELFKELAQRPRHSGVQAHPTGLPERGRHVQAARRRQPTRGPHQNH